MLLTSAILRHGPQEVSMGDTTSQSSTRRFRLLLRLLPTEFRGDFGSEMEQVFAEQRADAARRGDRMMRKNLGFTIAAIVVLGLGIGANTAICSVVNAVVVKPLPFEHGERLLMRA
jgi:hypothetical protein